MHGEENQIDDEERRCYLVIHLLLISTLKPKLAQEVSGELGKSKASKNK